ncbi:MAG: nucleotidyltransferase family protein [Clostridia bacterium]|jgi:predicted nucleotidyltransferase
MKYIGIISEYNPLHNGHKHQIDTLRQSFDDNIAIVSLLSSDFLQRGEPALLDKYARTNMALEAGVDIVIEYPAFFCCRSAEDYADNAIYLLDKLNIIDYISYGTKINDIVSLKSIAGILIEEPEGFRKFLRTFLDAGHSFARAREKALIDFLESSQNDAIPSIMRSSNDILAIEYEKSLLRHKSSIRSFPIKRVGSDYNDPKADGKYSSATAIRNEIFASPYLVGPVRDNVPASSFKILTEHTVQHDFINFESFKNEIFYALLSHTDDALQDYPNVNEGIEHLLKKYVIGSSSVSALISSCTTKRYPSTRIQRLLTHILLGIDNTMLQEYKRPQYARIIGCSNKGILSGLFEKSSIPIVTSLRKFYDSADMSVKHLIDFENKVCDIYSKHEYKESGQIQSEFSVKVRI